MPSRFLVYMLYRRGGKSKPSAVRYPTTVDASAPVEIVMPTASGFTPAQRSVDPPSLSYSSSSAAPMVVLSASAEPPPSSDGSDPSKPKPLKGKLDPRTPNKSPVVQKYWSPKTRAAPGTKLSASPMRPSPPADAAEPTAVAGLEFDVSVPDKTPMPAPSTATIPEGTTNTGASSGDPRWLVVIVGWNCGTCCL